MKKSTLAGLGLAIALTASAIAPQAASAYPPGRALSIASDANLVQYRSNGVRIALDNVASGRMKFSVNGKVSKYFSTKVSGSSQSWYFFPSAYGKFVITGTSGAESKSTTVYVPKQTLPRSMTVRKSFTMRMAYVAPGATVTAYFVGKSPLTGVADQDGNVSIVVPAGKLSRGSNPIYVNYGGAFTMVGKVKGLK